jgi:alpha-mannosidase
VSPLAPRPTLHVVALAHLDTQWRWTVRDTVRDHLPATVAANEALFERYPSYVLSFEGAHRYRLLEEHHPALFETVRRRVAEGRWSPAGAAVEAFDTLLPAPESILRQIVLGRRWFREHLNADSRDLFLPDCFGFPSTLPTLATHAGLVGFSTQKLRRGPLMRAARGIPFAFGRWRGPDGSELLAALDPGEYSGRIEGELERDGAWLERFAALASNGTPGRLLFYVGIGDRGGAVPESTVANLERALAAAGPIEVAHGRSEAPFAATTAGERARLPVHEGELLLRLHGTGCYSAKAILKRWNREGERLAFAAEAAAALATSLGRTPPRERIERAWWRLLAHQMHDDLTGTSIPAAYRFSLDALGLAANELAEALLDGVSRSAEALGCAGSPTAGDEASRETAAALFSPLGAPRAALVEIELRDGERPASAIGPAGEPLPCQLVERDGRRSALVPARFDGVELQVVELTARSPPTLAATGLAVEPDRLENDRYRARFDARGCLASLFDKRLERELLAAPLELELLDDRSPKYPAWEIRWEDLAAPPRETISTLVASEIVERGPLRAALRFEQRTRGVVVRSTWSLAAGDSDELLRLDLELDWRRRGRLLELRFPFTAANDRARYDTGLGAIARPIATEDLYEVPAHGWAALEDGDAGFGVAVLTDVPRGWNQPDGSTLRATLIHAPAPGLKFRHQATHDFGRHRWRFALAGLAPGAIDGGELARLSDGFRNPPLAFRFERADDSQAPRRVSLLSLAPPLRLLALAPAESPGHVLARLSNPSAIAASPRLELDAAVELERETDALGESAEGAAAGVGDALRALPPSGLRTLELRLPPPAPEPDDFRPVALPWSLRGFGRQGEATRDGGFDRHGVRFPLELAPTRLDDSPVPFDLAHVGHGADTAVADGRWLELEPGAAELWFLAAAVGGDRGVELSVNGKAVALSFPDWRAPFLVESRWRRSLGFGDVAPGAFRRAAVVWSSGHLHDRRGADLPVERASLFALCVPLDGAARLALPRDERLRLVAATLARRPARVATEAFPPPPP